MNFEDMMWLFTSTQHSRGVARLNIAEAALLWKYAARAEIGMLEIGRRHGGSTCLLAAANPGVPLASIDLRPEHNPKCEEFFQDNPVALLVGNSRTFAFKEVSDFIFIDGDHSYEGVKADFQNAIKVALPGTTVILFHDAVRGAYGTCPGVTQFVEELLAANVIMTLDVADSMLATKLL